MNGVRLKSPYLSGSHQGNEGTGNGAMYAPLAALHSMAQRTEDTCEHSTTCAGWQSSGAISVFPSVVEMPRGSQQWPSKDADKDAYGFFYT